VDECKPLMPGRFEMARSIVVDCEAVAAMSEQLSAVAAGGPAAAVEPVTTAAAEPASAAAAPAAAAAAAAAADPLAGATETVEAFLLEALDAACEAQPHTSTLLSSTSTLTPADTTESSHLIPQICSSTNVNPKP
jgi:hypothetical protein